MPAPSAVERQKLLLQQEIAKLSGAISSRTTHPSTSSSTRHSSNYHPYRGSLRGRGGYNGYPASTRGYSSRGGYTAGAYDRGRGSARGGRGSNSLDLRPNNPVKPSNAAAPALSVSSGSDMKEEGEMLPSPPPPTTLPSTDAGNAVAGPSSFGKVGVDEAQNWVKTSSTGNMSLMTAEKRKELSSRPKPARARKTRIPASIQELSSETGTPGKRVVVDGVIFEFEPGGAKLIRIGEVHPSPAGSGPSGSPGGTPTRRRVSYGGKQFRRTSRGNLVSSSAANTSRKYCRYYTRTGKCSRALICPYLHSPSHRSICPAFLRSSCPNTAETCLLSHTPSAHNTPSCLHFQATSTCKKGEACPYPHVKTAKDAPVCMAFAKEGWCDKDAGTCGEVHCWECPEFRAKGVCTQGGKCGLRHVLRAGVSVEKKGDGKGKERVAVYRDVQGDGLASAHAPSGSVESAGGVEKARAEGMVVDADQGNFDDGSTFIGLPGMDDDWEQDHGFPVALGDVSGEDSQEEEEDEEAEEDEEEGEEEEGGEEVDDAAGNNEQYDSSDEEQEEIEDVKMSDEKENNQNQRQ